MGMTPPLKYIFGELDNSVTLNATYWCTIMSIRNDMISGYADIIRIMAPLTDNPNAPNNNGRTPIYSAACYGFTEIVNILAPLTDDINAPNNYEETPSSVAKNDEILRIL